MAAMEQANYDKPKTKQTVCFGLVARNSNFELNTELLLQAMLKFPPFVKFESRDEAWAAVAEELKHTRGQDLEHVTNHVCEKRYREVKDEFQEREAQSKRANRAVENETHTDALVKELVALETEFELREQEQVQTEVDDFLASSSDQFEGYLSREETMHNMARSSSATCSSSSSSSIPTYDSQVVTTQSVRHNPLPPRRRRKQTHDDDDRLREEMFKTLKNLNELIDLAKGIY